MKDNGISQMTNRSRRSQIGHLLCLMCVLLFLSVTGCAKFDLRRNIPWQETSNKPVQSIVAFWSDAVIERTSGPPYRGFGGRLLFYPADMKRPIKVRGTVVVYAFDDNLPPPDNLKPLRKYVFTNEQLEQVYSDSKLGPSYNVLIPWDEYSPDAQRVSLIVRYIPEDGPSVVSEQARMFLPGLDERTLATAHTRGPSAATSAAPSLPSAQSNATGSQDRVSRIAEAAAVLPTSYQMLSDPVQPARSTRTPDPQVTDERAAEEAKRRMSTLTIALPPHSGGAQNPSAGGTLSPAPSAGSASNTTSPAGGSLANSTTTNERGGNNTQSGPAATWQAAEATPSAQVTNTGYGATQVSQAGLPPTPGQMVSDLSRQPPARFEPYQPLVRGAAAAQAPSDRGSSALSP